MAKAVTKRNGATKGQIAMEMEPAVSTSRPAPPRIKLTPSYDMSLLALRTAEPASEMIVDPAPDDDGSPPTRSTYASERAVAEPFGAWLVAQKGRSGLIGQLATAAAGDRALSKAATPQDLRKRMVEQQADGDMHDALDDAEIDWLAL